jgi:photosystem II stability/assembly factor-like uncharacterized protein
MNGKSSTMSGAFSLSLGTAFLFLFLSAAAFAQPPQVEAGAWTGFGPGSGSVSSVAVDPVDPTVVYAAAARVIYKSVDGGLTWKARVGPNFGLVAIDPSHPSTVYAAGAGIARSRDGGQTWRTVLADAHLIDSQIGDLTLAPNGTVFAVTTDRLLRSVDGGRTWTATPIDVIFHSTGFHSLQVDPADPSRLYIANEFQLWSSVDGGATWTKASNPPNQGLVDFQIARLALAPSSPATIYASLTNLGVTSIFRSDDGAATWLRVGEIPFLAERALLVDPGSASRLYAAGDGGIFTSGHGGQSWARLQTGLPMLVGRPLAFLSLAVAPSQPATLYAGSSGWGVARSTSAGARWRIGVETGSNAGEITMLKFHPSRPGTVYVAQAGGTRSFRSTDGGRSWLPFARDIALNGRLNDLAFDPVAPDTLYAATTDVGILKSTDGGEVWERLAGPAADRLALLGRQTLLAVNCGLSRSVDGGRTWTQVIACENGNGDRRYPISLWVDPQDSRTAYVHYLINHTQYFLFEVFKTGDGGATWTSLRFPHLPTAFAVAPSDSRVLYAVDSTLTIPTVYHLLRSDDGGASWKVVEAHLPVDAGILFGVLAVDAVNPYKLYLAAGDGLLISHDGGRTFRLNGAPLEVGKKTVLQLWTDRAQPGLVFGGAAYGGLYVGRFE